MNIALLTAAGTGSRMHQDIPKQFIHVENKPVIIHTMEAFQNHPSIDAILVVTLDSWKDVLWAYAKQFNIDKLKWVIAGGETGQESIKKGLDKLVEDCSSDTTVIIHDGNRPMISSEVISNSLAIADLFGDAVGIVIGIIFNGGLFFGKSLPIKEAFEECKINVSSGIILMLANWSAMLMIGGAKMIIQWRWDELLFGKVSFAFSVSNVFLVFVTAISVVLFPSLQRIEQDKLPQMYKSRFYFMRITFE